MSRFTDAILRASNGDKGIRVLTLDGAHTRYRWSEVRERAYAVGSGLAAAGVRSGDRIAALLSDPADVAALAQAAWLRGAALTLLQQPIGRTDSQLWSQSTREMLDVVEPELCVVGGAFLELERALNEVGVRTVTFGSLAALGGPAPVGVCAEDDIAVLQLSSGSTGTPKAVAVTHRAMYEHWTALTTRCSFSEADTFVSWLQLFHDMGMVGFMAGPMQSGIEVISASPEHFKSTPTIWPELLTEYGGTVTAGPNFAYAVLAQTLEAATPGAYDLSRLRLGVNGGEPIDPRAMRRLADVGARFGLAPAAVVGGYGMAEATLVVSGIQPGMAIRTEIVDRDRLEAEGRGVLAPPEGEYRRQELVVLGRPVPGMGVRVVDERGGRIPTRSIGEIQIRGLSVAQGYHTVKGWQQACDETGWLNTGDVGYLTDGGEIVLCGRKKDTIIIAGRNLFPTHIEWSASRVSGVRPGNTVAVRIDAEGREHFAVIVESNLHGDCAQVDRIRADVARVVLEDVGIAPKNVLVVAPGQIPKTSSGKVRRGAAATMFAPVLLDSDVGAA